MACDNALFSSSALPPETPSAVNEPTMSNPSFAIQSRQVPSWPLSERVDLACLEVETLV